MAPQQQETAMMFTSITIAVVVPLIVGKFTACGSLVRRYGVLVGAAVGMVEADDDGLFVGVEVGADDVVVIGAAAGTEEGRVDGVVV